MGESEEKVFVDAAACGDIADIKRLLADATTTADVINACDKDGRSALHYACLNDDVNLLPLLLADKRVDLGLTTPKKEGIFHMAGLYASLEALKLLTSHDQVKSELSTLINAQNKYGETPLHLCAGSGDKKAPKAAKIMLENGAHKSLVIPDNWNRGPLDCAMQNAEKNMIKLLEEFITTQSEEVKTKIAENSKKVAGDLRKEIDQSEEAKNTRVNLAATFTQMKGLQLNNLKANLKKTTTVEKHMFKSTQGNITNAKPTPAGSQPVKMGKILSKLIDFPGDRDEIAKLVKDPEVNVAGKDSFGLSALHKFASWNKPELIEMILPQLSPEQLNEPDLDGKTALHWACEMASVSTVSYLVSLGADKTIKDKKGRTAMDILETGSGSVIGRLKKALNGES